MTEDASHRSNTVPPRAAVYSLAAFMVPILGALAFPERLGDAGALLWLLALVPAFLLAYYRGWKGVATALAVGMAVLSLTQAAVVAVNGAVPDLLFWIVVAYLGICVAIGWMAERLHRDRASVENLALTDLITRLPNRRHARVFLRKEMAAAERGRPLSIVFFDLDSFKEYNDRYGHQIGDEALKRFGEILAANTRRMNLSARIGGEEFLTVLAATGVDGACVFAERIRATLQDARLARGALTVSVGVAAYQPSMSSTEEFLAAADLALYRAKRDGRNCVRVFGVPRRAPAADGFGDVPGASGPQSGSREPETAGREDGRSRSPPAETTSSSAPDPHVGEGRRLLLVEDDEAVRKVLSDYLEREAFTVLEASDVNGGRKHLSAEVDVVITDMRLPGRSGTELVEVVKSRWPATQVVVITGFRDAQFAAEALNAGADHYLFKPFELPDLRSHLVEALTRRDRILAERRDHYELSAEARRRNDEVRQVVLKGARALVRAVEVRDPYIRGHSDRVATYATTFAGSSASGSVDPDSLRLACELHDVGKIGIPDAILNKQGPLSGEELLRVWDHPRTGRRILEPLLSDEIVLSVTSWHHERWDGEGYPDGLAGESIPLPARIVAVADTLDAMTSSRAYRPAFTWGAAAKEILAGFGTQFDPSLEEPFREILPRLEALFHTKAMKE